VPQTRNRPHLVSVQAHGGQQESGDRNGSDVAVAGQFADDLSQNPLAEHDEQDMRRHRDEADHQITDRQVQHEDIDNVMLQCAMCMNTE